MPSNLADSDQVGITRQVLVKKTALVGGFFSRTIPITRLPAPDIDLMVK